VEVVVLEVLAAHREEQKQDKSNFGTAYNDNDLMFCQPNGAFYSPDHVGTRTKVIYICPTQGICPTRYLASSSSLTEYLLLGASALLDLWSSSM